MIEKYNYGGGENLGFNAVVTNNYILVPPEFKRKKFFDVDNVIETRIAKTNLVGLFSAGNSNGLIVPKEISGLEEDKLEDSGINFTILDSRYNALGNLILCNDKGAVISPKLEEFKEKISEALEVDVIVNEISGLNPGVSGLANSKGAVIHRDASEEDAQNVMDTLNLEDIDIGTVNMGSPFTGSGAVCNDNDLLTGENTTGPEIGRFDRTLF